MDAFGRQTVLWEELRRSEAKMACRTLPQGLEDNIKMDESKQLLCERLSLDSHGDETLETSIWEC